MTGGEHGVTEGVDYDMDMVNDVNYRPKKNNLSDKAVHHQANVYAPPFPDAHFDAVRSGHLFMHLADPERALAEAVRVTKSAGRVVLLDTDWDSLYSYTGVDDIEQRLVKFRAEEFYAMNIRAVASLDGCELVGCRMSLKKPAPYIKPNYRLGIC